jgi:PAS domain S-box-containing protein
MEFSTVMADLRRDPSLAPFLKPEAAVIVWSPGEARPLWASAKAVPLLGALTTGEPAAPTMEAERYVRALAERAPDTGMRLERWRIPVGRRMEPVTMACRSISTAQGRALLTAVVGALPKGLDWAKAVSLPTGPAPAEPPVEAAAPEAAAARPMDEEPPSDFAPQDQLTRLRQLAAERRTMRFVWASDEAGRLTRVSPELAEVVGPEAAAVVGRRWDELVGDIVRDPAGGIAAALAGGTTWPRLNVVWRVGQGEAFLPVELGAVPVPGETEAFYRGYGLCRLTEIEEAAPASQAPAAEEAEEPQAASAAVEPQAGEAPAQTPTEDGQEELTTAVADLPQDEAGENAVGFEDHLAAAETGEATPEPTPAEPAAEDGAEQFAALADQAASAEGTAAGAEQPLGTEEPTAETVAEEAATETAAKVPAEEGEAEDALGTDIVEAAEDAAPEDEREPADAAEQAPAVEAASEERATEPAIAEAISEPEAATGEQLQDEAAREALTGAAEEPATVEPAAEEPAAPEQAEIDEEPVGAESIETAESSEEAVEPAAEVAESVIAAPEAEPEAPAAELSAEAAAPETAEPDAPAPFAPVRGQVGATLGAPKVVPLRVVDSNRAAGAEAARPTLSPTERNAFREIARALGARYLGEEEPAGPPAKTEEPATDQSAHVEEAAPQAAVPPGMPAPSHEPEPEIPPKPRPSARQVTFTGDRPSFAPLTDKLPIGILVSRGDDILYANRTLLDFLGYPDVAALAEVGLWNLFTSRAQVGDGAAPIALKAANGADLAVDARLSTLEWNGAPATLLSFRRAHEPEIADRIRMLEQELVAHEGRAQELSLILDTATDGVIVLDEGGRILSLNRSAEALFGYEESDVAGEFFTLLLAPDSHVVAVDYLEGLKAGGVASVMNDGREVVGRVRQGGRIPLMVTMGRISEPPHRKFCLVARDMTAFKKAEADLLKAKKAAEEASAQKSDFLAKISHEIRTPLNAIIGFAEVMQEERFGPIGNERYKEYLKDIHVSGGHVISLINDLLDLAKIEAGRLELNFVSVNLNDVVASCVALMQPEASRNRIVLRTSLAPKLPPVVADERAMRQVVLNILSNAVKFTDAGGQVIVSTALTDRGEVALRVRDTGIGMTDTEIAQALEPFRQLATARRHGGTGLGLPLTKALVEANRGALAITSAKREGTLVEIVLPRTRVLAE